MRLEQTLPYTLSQAKEAVEVLINELEAPMRTLNMTRKIDDWNKVADCEMRYFTIGKGAGNLKGCMALRPAAQGITVSIELTGFLVSLFKKDIVKGFDAIVAGAVGRQ